MMLLNKSPAQTIFSLTNLPLYSFQASWYYTRIDERGQIWNVVESIVSPVTLLGAGLRKGEILCEG